MVRVTETVTGREMSIYCLRVYVLVQKPGGKLANHSRVRKPQRGLLTRRVMAGPGV